MRAALFVAMMAACQAGGDSKDSDTTEDTTGDPGTTPDPTGDGEPAGLVWVDAEGEVVDRVAEIDGELMWQDDEGWWWQLSDSEPWFKPDIGPLSTVATDDACEDLWFPGITIHPARVVLLCDSVSTGAPYCARAGEIAPETLPRARRVRGDGCDPEDELDEVAVPLDDVATFDALPAPSWTPPLHPEWR